MQAEKQQKSIHWNHSLYLSFWYDVETQSLIYNTCPHLREVALIGNQTTPAKTAGAAHLVEPLGPLGVEMAVRLLIFGLEHTNILLDI